MRTVRGVAVAFGLFVVSGIAGVVEHQPARSGFDFSRTAQYMAAGFSRIVFAQDAAAPTQGLVRKGKVPVSNEILKITFPRPSETTLSNGLRLLVLEERRLPQVSFQLVIPGAGGYDDPPDRPGLAAFTAALMREGTPTRTSTQIAQQLEIMAATLNIGAGSSPEATIAGSCLSDQAATLIDLAADILLHPTFPEEEIARYKQRMRGTLAQQRGNPGFLAAEMFSKAVYGSHPAARISPTLAALDGLKREDGGITAPGLPHRAVSRLRAMSMLQARIVAESKLGAWKNQPSRRRMVPEPAARPGSSSSPGRTLCRPTSLSAGHRTDEPRPMSSRS